jgi:hypothetical protein
MKEQKRLNFENYVFQKLLIHTGCRINAAIYLKVTILNSKIIGIQEKYSYLTEKREHTKNCYGTL